MKKSVHFLAKRFAAKEAALKAFGIGLRDNLSFNDFGIFNNKNGKPILKLFNYAFFKIKKLEINKIHLSITDERKYACAIVIFEK